jgi:FkbM family methyltransferase
MKAILKAFLNQLGLREFIWDSQLYSIYLRLANRSAYENMRSHVTFFRGIRDNCRLNRVLWFDIGANVGSRTALFRQICGKVVAVEPDPTNFLVLQRRFRFSRRVCLIQAAVGRSCGRATLIRPLGKDAGAYSTLSTKQLECLAQNRRYEMTPQVAATHDCEVAVTTLDQLILKHGMPSYVKIDVEGYEKEVLEGLTRVVPWISFEANLPDFEDETIACLEHCDSLAKHVLFNFTVSEPPKFVESGWLSLDEISSVVRSKRYPYMEIYCWQS